MNHRGSSGSSPASGLGHQTYNMESLNRTSGTNAAIQRSNANPKILFSLLSHAAGRQGSEDDQFSRQNVSLNETMEYNENKVVDEFKVPSSAPHVNPAAIHQHSMTSSSSSKPADLSSYREPDYYPQPQQQKVKSVNGNGSQPTAGDFLMPMYNRPRSKSMGNGCLVRRVPEQMHPAPPPPPVVNNGSSSYWCPGGLYNPTNNGTRSVSRATSRDSLVSFDESIASSYDDYGSSYSGGGGYSLPPFAAMFPPQFPYSSRRNTGDPSNFASSRRGRRVATESADVLLEDARSQLMRLTTDAGDGGRPRSPSSIWQPMDDLDEQYSLSQPPSPPGTTNSSLHSAHHHQQQAHYYNMLQQQVQPNVRKYSEGSHQLKSRLTPGMPWRQRTSSLQTGGAVHPAAAAAVAAAATQRYSNSLNNEEPEDQSVSGPLNLSCKRVKRKKYDPVINWPYARRGNVAGNGAGSRYGGANNGGFPTSSSLGYASSDMTASIDEGIDNDDDAASDCSSNSILKSILLQTPRGRSYSMSVCIGRQNNAAANYPAELSSAAPAAWLARAKLRIRESNESSTAASPSGRSAVMGSPSGQTPQQQQQQPRHQRVVLAKKNQIPVTARVIEYLNKILALVSHVPRFEQFTLADRRTLLLSSCGRLLLLCMAESNLEFAVTTVNDTTTTTSMAASPSLSTLSELGIVAEQHISVFNGDELENASSSSSGTAAAAAAAGEDFLPRTSSFSSRHPSAVVDAETPTQHFVDTVQNFIRKCQSLGIDVEEYRLMGAIALFQTGSARLMRGDLADAMHADARQRLADYIQKTRPSEKLRYSNILLALRTLFGINCAMLQSLFYRPSPGAASFNEFICNALNAGTGVSGNDVTLELAKSDVGVEFDDVVDDNGGRMVADEMIS